MCFETNYMWLAQIEKDHASPASKLDYRPISKQRCNEPLHASGELLGTTGTGTDDSRFQWFARSEIKIGPCKTPADTPAFPLSRPLACVNFALA